MMYKAFLAKYAEIGIKERTVICSRKRSAYRWSTRLPR